ncbi:putative RING-H2 finger protein ATL71-like [Capsicum annuum]|nr:putative RING-H2 finger protein ATL71-like [Capsicum annuum]
MGGDKFFYLRGDRTISDYDGLVECRDDSDVRDMIVSNRMHKRKSIEFYTLPKNCDITISASFEKNIPRNDALAEVMVMEEHESPNSTGYQGTRIIIYNLYEDEGGATELDFDTDPHDIQTRGVGRDEKKIEMAKEYPNLRHFLTYQHSLRSYASILYLRLAYGFRKILRGKEVKLHNFGGLLIIPFIVLPLFTVGKGSLGVTEKSEDVLREIPLNTGSSLYSEDAFLITGEESRLSIDVEETEKNLEVFQTLKESFLKAYKVMDKELRSYTNIDCFCSGIAIVTLVKQERFEEILREKTLSEFDIDQFEAYYQAAGGEKKRRVFVIGSEAKGYCEQTLCVSCGKISSSASHELCLAFAIFDIVDDVGCFKNSWLMFGTMDVLDIIMCLDVAMFGIVDGFNVSHKNRLIKPFWRVWNTSGSDGCDVIGVLEANFVEPANDKQGFERTIVLARLEAYLQVIQKYWSSNYHFIGHAKRRNVMNTIVSPDQKEPNAYSAPTIKSCSPFSSNVGNTACHDDRSKLKSTPVKREMGPVHSSIKDSSVQKASHVCVGTRKVPQPVQGNTRTRYLFILQYKQQIKLCLEIILSKRLHQNMEYNMSNDLRAENNSIKNSLKQVLHHWKHERAQSKTLACVLLEERRQQAREEESLRSKLKDASVNIQDLLNKVRLLESSRITLTCKTER